MARSKSMKNKSRRRQRGGFLQQSVNGMRSATLKHLLFELTKGDKEAEDIAIEKLKNNSNSVLLNDTFMCSDSELPTYMDNLKKMAELENIPEEIKVILFEKLTQIKEKCYKSATLAASGAATLGGRRKRQRTHKKRKLKTHKK